MFFNFQKHCIICEMRESFNLGLLKKGVIKQEEMQSKLKMKMQPIGFCSENISDDIKFGNQWS